MWLFGALAAEEVSCGLGEDEADGDIWVVGEGLEDVRDLDRCY